jgi:Na+-driven multidrug efflux pump
MMLGMPLLLVFILYTQLLRGVGDTVTPLLALCLSTAVGLLLTPALIRGWLGLPRLGVVSAAVAGWVSFALALAFLWVYLRRKRHPLAPDAELLRALRIDARLLRAVLRIGVPTGVQMVTIALAELAILSLVNGYGADATAAMARSTRSSTTCSFRPCRLPSRRPSSARRPSAPAASSACRPSCAPACC